MKKICHVLSGFFRNDTRIFFKQCKSLANEGYEVYILTNDGIPDEIKDNIKIISCWADNKNRIQEILNAKSTFLKKAIDIDADIYQLHGPELIPLGLSLKKLNKKVFYDAHEDLPNQILEKKWIPGIMRKPLSVITEFYLKNTLRKFDEIFSVTPHIVEKLKSISDSVTMVTNYPIIEKKTEFTFDDYCKRENILCYSGTVYHGSNQEYILAAILNVENVKYHIAGIIDNVYFDKLSCLPSSPKVKFLGRIQKHEMEIFYQNAIIGMAVHDYSLNLGYRRGTIGSNKLFEYMNAGLPIICTDFDLWKEIVDKYECGIYVEPNNAKKIEDAIRFLIENKERAYLMGQNGKKAITQEYNWGTQEMIYVDVFKKYLN